MESFIRPRIPTPFTVLKVRRQERKSATPAIESAIPKRVDELRKKCRPWRCRRPVIVAAAILACRVLPFYSTYSTYPSPYHAMPSPHDGHLRSVLDPFAPLARLLYCFQPPFDRDAKLPLHVGHPFLAPHPHLLVPSSGIPNITLFDRHSFPRHAMKRVNSILRLLAPVSKMFSRPVFYFFFH